MRQTVSRLMATASVAVLVATAPALAASPRMVSSWGTQISPLLVSVLQLSQDPSQSARVNAGLADMGAGAKLGSSLGSAFIGWAAGDEYRPIGTALGALFGAGLGQSGGASVGITMEQAHDFLVKDQDLLGQIDAQLGQLLDDAQPGSSAATQIAALDNEARNELTVINSALPNWYNPKTIATIRVQFPALANNAKILTTATDALTKKLTGG